MSGYGRQVIFTVAIGVLIAVAIGVGVYYLQPQLTSSTSGNTTLPHQGSIEESNVIFCQVSYYTVYSVESISDSSTFGGYSTQTSSTTYTTTTTANQTVGYVTSTAMNFTGTLTGAAAKWTVSGCTYRTP